MEEKSIPKKKIKPQIPRKIKIGPAIFDVISSKGEFAVAAQKFADKDEDSFGFMDYRSQKIFVDPEQADDSKRDTQLHEVLHAVWQQAGGQVHFGEEVEEKVIAMITAGLLQVLQENPSLVKYLTEK